MDLCFKNIIVIIIENVLTENQVNNRTIKTDEHADNAANRKNLNRNAIISQTNKTIPIKILYAKRIPIRTATPLPPLNFSQTGNKCLNYRNYCII